MVDKCSFAALDSALENRGLDRGDGKWLLTSQAEIKRAISRLYTNCRQILRKLRCLMGISKYKVDLASDGLRGFGVVACQ